MSYSIIPLVEVSVCVSLFYNFVFMQISRKIDPSDPNAEKTQAITEEITKLCCDHTGSQDDLTLASRYPQLLPLAGLVAVSAVIMTYYAYQKGTLS